MNYKLIVWGDISIPATNNYKWLAQDMDGSWWIYARRPKADQQDWLEWSSTRELCKLVRSDINIAPPEPGPWNEQLYWIG